MFRLHFVFSPARDAVFRLLPILAILPAAVLPTGQAQAADKKAPAKESDWKFTIGAGGGYSPDYEGSDDYAATALPLVDISWRDTLSLGTIGGPGLKVNFLKIKGPTPKDHLVLTAALGYGGGRDAGDNDALAGLGDLDAGALGGLSARYQAQNLGLGLSAERDLTGDREGLAVSGEVSYALPFKFRKTRVSVSSSTTWADDNHMENTFGISSAQAAASALGYNTYRASSGFKDVGASLSIRHGFTENIGLMVKTSYTHLLGDAADSPLVSQQGSESQFSAMMGLSYSW